MSHFQLDSFRMVIVVLALAAIGGCSGDSDDLTSASEPTAEAVDPRFATPEALVQYFNSLNTRMPPDMPNMLPLYHLETEFQKKKHLVQSQSMGPYYELEVAMWAQFDDGISQKARSKQRPCTAATLTKSEASRAEASYIDNFGKPRPLHLIKVGERWWVSGYTLEYATEADQRELVESMADFMIDLTEDSAREVPPWVSPMIARIRGGEFADAEAARKAIANASREYFQSRLGR